MNSTQLVPATQAQLPVLDRFSTYARAVSRIAPLSEKEEQDLVSRWRHSQDPQAARALVLGYLYLVVKQVRAHQGYGLPAEDLAQEGTLGLMQAVQKYDARPGVRLGTYAWYWIDARIKEYILRNWRMVSLGVSSLAKKLFFGYRRALSVLANEGVKAPSVAELAQSMEISEEEAQLARTYFMGGDVALFDEQDDEEGFEVRPLAMLPSNDLTPEQNAIVGQRQALANALYDHVQTLPPRQAQVLRERFLSEPSRTLSSLAKEWGVSIERVRQVEKQALAALKEKLGSSKISLPIALESS